MPQIIKQVEGEVAVKIEKSSFTWGDGQTVLEDIEVTIPKGQFVCIIGDVGSGKSSLLNAIIGDLMPVES
jgi:ABC-type nitrate/sulfonate/bicarbonate transport system ATPase subunit